MILMLNGKSLFLHSDLLTIQYFSLTMRTIKCEFLETKEANLFPSLANFVPSHAKHTPTKSSFLNDSMLNAKTSLVLPGFNDDTQYTMRTIKCDFLEKKKQIYFPRLGQFFPLLPLPCCPAHANCLCFDKS